MIFQAETQANILTIELGPSIFTPSVVFLGDTDIRALYGIFTAVGVFGMLVASLLPESFGEDFPECIEDLEKKPGHPYFR